MKIQVHNHIHHDTEFSKNVKVRRVLIQTQQKMFEIIAMYFFVKMVEILDKIVKQGPSHVPRPLPPFSLT